MAGVRCLSDAILHNHFWRIRDLRHEWRTSGGQPKPSEHGNYLSL